MTMTVTRSDPWPTAEPPPVGPLGLRVMAPMADATVDGRRVRLSWAQLKLLVGLALEHPTPLHVEQASDLLWPDLATTATTRGRLNAVVYRLRCRLGPRGDVVWRDGDLLGLDGTRCDVDLWRFHRNVAGDAALRRQAVSEVKGMVCDAQFPYDERFVDERRRLAGLWLRQARALLRDGELVVADLGYALRALRLEEDDLGL